MSDVSSSEGSGDTGNPAPAAAPVVENSGEASGTPGNAEGTNLNTDTANGSAVSAVGTNLNEAGPGFDFAAHVNPDNLSTVENKGWKDVDSLIQSYGELERKIGERQLEAPDPEVATQEDWDGYYDALGRPDEPAEYGFTMPEGVSENFQYDSEFADNYRQMAHRAGLTQRQANQLHGDYVAMMSDGAEQNFQSMDSQVGDAHASLQELWGEEGSTGYSRNVEMATRAMDQLGLKEAMVRRGIMAPGGAVLDTDFVVALAKIGENNYAEDNMFGGVGTVVTNPFADKTENMTISSQMIANDPSRARNLIAAAGKKPEDYGL